jgi:hypothetical protein
MRKAPQVEEGSTLGPLGQEPEVEQDVLWIYKIKFDGFKFFFNWVVMPIFNYLVYPIISVAYWIFSWVLQDADQLDDPANTVMQPEVGKEL